MHYQPVLLSLIIIFCINLILSIQLNSVQLAHYAYSSRYGPASRAGTPVPSPNPCFSGPIILAFREEIYDNKKDKKIQEKARKLVMLFHGQIPKSNIHCIIWKNANTVHTDLKVDVFEILLTRFHIFNKFSKAFILKDVIFTVSIKIRFCKLKFCPKK